MTAHPSPQIIKDAYLNDLKITAAMDVDFLNQLQSKHIARYSFNSLAVVLGHDISLEIEAIFNKIVEKKRGGYCLPRKTFKVLTFDLLNKVVCRLSNTTVNIL